MNSLIFQSADQGSKFSRGFAAMTVNEKWILVEGNLNKAFYFSFGELSALPIINGGSCSEIIIKVNEAKSKLGIIDNDFRMLNEGVIDRVFRIDFYSIENIILLYHNNFVSLQEILLASFSKLNIEERRLYCHYGRIKRNTSKRPEGYEVNISDMHHEQYSRYLSNTIVDAQSFFRYMQLKELVVSYNNYLIEKNELSKNDYILQLYNKLPSKKMSILFNRTEFERIEKSIQY